MSLTQKNFTIPPDKREFIKENYPKLTIDTIARSIKFSRNKVRNNMVLMGLAKRNYTHRKDEVPEGYFNIKEFAKAYKI